MRRLQTRLDGPVLIEPHKLGDDRGFFCETTGAAYFKSSASARRWFRTITRAHAAASCAGCTSRSTGAAKPVRCARGAIVDVMVDIRRGSPTFGEWEAFELNEDNLRAVYCPIGFAHGFCVVSDLADVMYKQSNYYADETERGIAYDDPDVAIEWPRRQRN